MSALAEPVFPVPVLDRSSSRAPSESDWTSQLPARWSVRKVKHVVRFLTGWTPPSANPEYYDGNLPWANIGDLGPRSLSKTARCITEQAVRDAGAQVSPKGSLLFAFKLSIGAVSFAAEDIYTNEAIATFLPSEDVALEYFYYAAPVLVVRNARDNIYGAPLLNRELIANARIALPPMQEQRAIAAFLDRETAKLDALIAKKEQVLALLGEERTALTIAVITQGLDSTALLRDSGVDWLGGLPGHWQVVPLKHMTNLVNGAAFKPSDWSDAGVPIIRIENLNGGDSFNRTSEQVPERYHVHEGDLLFGWFGNRGTSFGPFRWARPGLHYLNQHIFRLTGFDCDRDWFYWVLKAATAYIEQQAHGIIGMVHVTRTELGNVPLPLPPHSEQVEIARYLDAESARIDRMIAAVRSGIEVLREYRAALITAAVTGQLDVRGRVPELEPAA